MNKFEIEIPDGKVAKWVNGVLTLVDEEPQDITERIKTFEDACNMLGDEHPLVTEYKLIAGSFDIRDELLAYLKLRIICEALNEGWKPTFNEHEIRYYPWVYIYTKEEYKELDEDEKIKFCVIGRPSYNSNVHGGFSCANENFATSYSSSSGCSRLVFKTRDLVEYCGRQFIDIWFDFLFG